MKVIFNRDDLIETMAPLMGAVSNKNTIPSIEGILFNCKTPAETENGESFCSLCAYDTEKGMRTFINADVLEGGFIIINAAKLFQVVRAMPEGEIIVTVDDKLRTTITGGGGRSNFEMRAMPGEDFPRLPELSGEIGFAVPQHVVRKFITKTNFAMALNDQRPAFNGAYFKIENGLITVVTCDGNRLAICSRDCTPIMENKNKNGKTEISLQFIVPNKTLAELLRLIKDDEETVDIIMGRKHVIFRFEKKDGDSTRELIFFSRLIESDYIDYMRIIPEAHKIVIHADADELRGAIERAALITEDRAPGTLKSFVKLDLENGVLNVSSESPMGRVCDEILVSQEGDGIKIGFNCRYLMEAFRCCDCDRIKVSMTSPLMGISIENGDAEINEEEGTFLYFVMPTRMVN